MNNVVVKNNKDNSEDFVIGQYNNISVLIRKSDGYINATEMCNQFGK